MRNAIVLLSLLALAACADDFEKKAILPTASKARPAAVAVAAIRFDTMKASSICKASLRASLRARVRLDQEPGDVFAKSRVSTFDALISDACK
ncbi:MAG TPA: hypothetical protein VGQ17_03300 [Gemmatimonadales bacterium]|jgi:hypothetical protein|nr:hypothetical protein [Gemmatimonadales bacterium]